VTRAVGYGVVLALVAAVAVAAVAIVAVGRWWRRCVFLVGFTVAAGVSQLGPIITGTTVAVIVGAGVVWRWGWPGSFRRVVVSRVRASQRRCWYRQHWPDLMVGHGLGQRTREATTVPRLGRRIACGPWLDRLYVRPLVGQDIEDWEHRTEALAMALGVREVRVALDRPGLVGVEVLRSDPLAAEVPALPVPATVQLGAVAVGVAEDGTAWTVRLTGNHVLVAGVTGAGKSSVVWSTIQGLAPAIRTGVVQLWGVDPKGGMELGAGRALFARFAAGDLVGMVELLEAAVAAMGERAARYSGHRRTHEASRAEPLIVVVVDELAFLTAYAGDRQLRDRANKALAVLLTQGRAVGVCVVAALQDPRKEVLGYRNLFPTKIALRLDERTQVDMVLGDGARAAGARCDRIGDRSPGVGYVKVDGIREPRRVRAGHVTDTDIAELAARYPAPIDTAEGSAA
jgi:S-DNA-T family DNA segregation ATPase FtsK/SpoIIIE